MNPLAHHALAIAARLLGQERSGPPLPGIALLIAMPLDQFAEEGCPLEIRVPWLPVSLWFVPGEADAEALAKEGVGRGRVWTARELMDLLAIEGLTSEQVKTLAQAKLEFEGEVVEVRERGPYHDPERGGEPTDA